MSGAERRFFESSEFTRPNDCRSSTKQDTLDLWKELQSLPSLPNTAEPHLPSFAFNDSTAPTPNTGSPNAKWTIAVDLPTDLVNHDGARPQQLTDANLRQLVETSRGNPDIAIAVQLAHSPEIQVSADSLMPKPGTKLDRYIIRDGKIIDQQTVDSNGLAADQTGLLRYATKAAPSEHIGMVELTHGMGGEGMAGDTGRESLNQLNDAIHAGLEGSGHDRLDVLDLNACSMATPSVLGALSNTANFVVASEARERASKNFVGGGAQNFPAALENLFQYPQTSPADLSADLVRFANQGNVPEVLQGDPLKHVGADILAAYDSSQYRQFADSLNSLGTELRNAAQRIDVKEKIEALFDQPHLLPTDSNFVERKDLREFIQGVKSAAESGELPDPNGAIYRAAASVLAAQEKMTTIVSGNSLGGYDQLGGMYVSLPVEDVRNGNTDGALGLHRLDRLIDSSPPNRDRKTDMLEQVSNEILTRLSESSKLEFKPVVDAIGRVKNARNDDEYDVAMQGLNDTVQGLMNSRVENELMNLFVYKDDIPLSDQWNAFTSSFVPV